MNGRNFGGQTALHEAAGAGRAPVIRALIGMGAMVDAVNEDGETPLMTAAKEPDDCAAMAALLMHGANVKARNSRGNTPLHLVASRWEFEYLGNRVKLLLKWDADEMAVNSAGFTVVALFESEHPFDNRTLRDLEMDDDLDLFADIDDVRRMFARAPAERRSRAWRRRCLLVLWRARPEKFQPSEGVVPAPAGGAEPRVGRSRVAQDQAVAAGLSDGDKKDDFATERFLARVVGLEEEGIFRGIVMFL